VVGFVFYGHTVCMARRMRFKAAPDKNLMMPILSICRCHICACEIS